MSPQKTTRLVELDTFYNVFCQGVFFLYHLDFIKLPDGTKLLSFPLYPAETKKFPWRTIQLYVPKSTDIIFVHLAAQFRFRVQFCHVYIGDIVKRSWKAMKFPQWWFFRVPRGGLPPADYLILGSIVHGCGQTLCKTSSMSVKCFPVSSAQFMLNQEL